MVPHSPTSDGAAQQAARGEHFESIHHVLEVAAADNPRAEVVRFIGGPSISRQELLSTARQAAGGLRSAGVRRGDRVALMVSNRREFLEVFFAVSSLGAVCVPLNTALRGDILIHMLKSVGPCYLIMESDLAAEAMPAVEGSASVTAIWGVPVEGYALPRGSMEYADLLGHGSLTAAVDCADSDLAAILFTSGTTGPSKGVMWSHRMAIHFGSTSSWAMGYRADDVVFTCLPLFHINALFTSFLPALQQKASVVIAQRFSASTYWAEIAESGATVTNMLGAMVAILWNRPPSDEERDHRLRLALIIPFPLGREEEYRSRFGLELTELYGSTDTGMPIATPHGESRAGACGIAAPGWEVKLFDEFDRPVKVGESGELVTRPTAPFVGQLGYWRLPEKTWEAHRNSWFHTGDQFREDEDGWFYFQDRLKDAMRVSGENVSSYEVEQVLLSHPAVAEVAVFAVPSDLGEDSVMAGVVLREGEQLNPADLREFAEPRLPYFAVPRYFEMLDDLPKTSTQKIRKAALRERGVSIHTWDGGQLRRGRIA